MFDKSLLVLRYSTMQKLGSQLNQTRILLTKDGKLRDWRGLADSAGLDHHEKQEVSASANQTKKVISIWCRKDSCQATVSDLLRCLESMDRFDVIDDIKDMLEADCREAPNLSVINLSQGDYTQTLSLADYEAVSKNIALPRFHAIVLFNENDEEDLKFGIHVVERMEAVGLRVFVPQRDQVAGTAEHATRAEIIHQRCDRVVAICSGSFLQSQANVFLLQFARHQDIVLGTNKIIPIVFRACTLPPIVEIITKLPYKDYSELSNFWHRLLVQTFKVKYLPPELSKYDPRFAFLGSEDPQSSSSAASASGSGLTSQTTSSSSFTASTILSVSSMLPSPPTHDPNSGELTPIKKKKFKKLNLMKRFIKGSKKVLDS